MPQHGPSTCSIRIPGGASNVVRMGILCAIASAMPRILRARQPFAQNLETWPRPVMLHTMRGFAGSLVVLVALGCAQAARAQGDAGTPPEPEATPAQDAGQPP